MTGQIKKVLLFVFAVSVALAAARPQDDEQREEVSVREGLKVALEALKSTDPELDEPVKKIVNSIDGKDAEGEKVVSNCGLPNPERTTEDIDLSGFLEQMRSCVSSQASRIGESLRNAVEKIQPGATNLQESINNFLNNNRGRWDSALKSLTSSMSEVRDYISKRLNETEVPDVSKRTEELRNSLESSFKELSSTELPNDTGIIKKAQELWESIRDRVQNSDWFDSITKTIQSGIKSVQDLF